MNAISKFLDEYLQTTGRESIGAVEANALLDKAGILKDNPQRPGLPLRNKLRKGELPYAYQVAGKGSEWVIPLSTAKREETAQRERGGSKFFQGVTEELFRGNNQ